MSLPGTRGEPEFLDPGSRQKEEKKRNSPVLWLYHITHHAGGLDANPTVTLRNHCPASGRVALSWLSQSQQRLKVCLPLVFDLTEAGMV